MRYKRFRDEDEWVLLDEIPSLNVHELLGRYEVTMERKKIERMFEQNSQAMTY